MPAQQLLPLHLDIHRVALRHVEHRPGELAADARRRFGDLRPACVSKSQAGRRRGARRRHSRKRGWSGRRSPPRPPGRDCAGLLWAARNAGSTPGFRQHFLPFTFLPFFVPHSSWPDFQQLRCHPNHDAGTTCSHSTRSERLSFLRAPGRRPRGRCRRRTGRADIGTAAVDGPEMADLLVDPGEQPLRRGERRGRLCERRGARAARISAARSFVSCDRLSVGRAGAWSRRQDVNHPRPPDPLGLLGRRPGLLGLLPRRLGLLG